LANPAAIGAVVVATLLQLATMAVTPVARILGLVPLHPAEWAGVVALAAIPAVTGQLIKLRQTSERI
jgi:hypothetical protein